MHGTVDQDQDEMKNAWYSRLRLEQDEECTGTVEYVQDEEECMVRQTKTRMGCRMHGTAEYVQDGEESTVD